MDIKAGQPVPQTYKDWFRSDLRHANEWRKRAKVEYDFRDGNQYTEDEREELEEKGKPDTEFNFVGPIVDAVSGQEISNRQEVAYLPREREDQQATELLTSAALWFRDRADADDADSFAFRDAITGGMGWTETRLSYEDNPDGELVDDRIDPFEMVWDYNAKKPNLVDATRLWRVRCIPVEEAEEFIEGLVDENGKEVEFTAEDLHAEWAADGVWYGNSDPHVSEPTRDRMAGKRNSSGELEEVVIVHCQWIERETFYRVPMPQMDGSTKPADLSEEDYAAFKKQGAARGIKFDAKTEEQFGIRKRMVKVRYQAFIGNKVLKVMPCACSGLPTKTNPQTSQGHFNFKCITGKHDQNKNLWYGIVRAAVGPQSWNNKLYSELLYIVATSAKGGIMAERGIFDNDNDAEDSWARQDRITWVKAGRLSGQSPGWAPKPVVQVPPALQYLLEVASTAIFKATGVNMELLGMREADQAGVLEYQRRQAGLTILQAFFDNLKAYRRQQGELILWYIQNDLSDGRFIRIVGKQDAPSVPLTKQATLEYDVIVADAPTSPNQKEKTWQLITQMLPIIKDMLTPDVMLALAEDSPLPSSTVQKLQKLSQQASESPAAKMQQKMGELEAMVLETKAALQAAQAEKAKADAMKAMNEQPADPNAELALKEAETTGKLAIESQKAQTSLAIKQQEQAGTMALKEREMAFDQQMRASQQSQDMALQAQSASADMQRADQAFAAEQSRADRSSASDIARKDAQAKAALKRPQPKAKK